MREPVEPLGGPPGRFRGRAAFCAALVALGEVAALGVSGDGQPLDPLLGEPALWEKSADEIVGSYGIAFRWNAAEHSTAHYPAFANSPELSFLGLKAWEINLRAREDRPTAIEISFYNRGDAGDMDEKRFQAFRTGVENALDEWCGGKGTDLPSVRARPGMVEKRRRWTRAKATEARLRWSATDKGGRDFRSEYVTLTLAPLAAAAEAPADRGRPGGSPGRANATTTRANVRHETNGVVCIDHMPMVDQGMRGYCTVASAERILRYYGRDVDQDRLAQLADTATGGGTSLDKMLDAFSEQSAKWGVRVKPEFRLGLPELAALVERYNNAARRARRAPVAWKTGPVINITATLEQMEPDLLLALRRSDASGQRAFLAAVRRHVDNGVPLVWSVILGWVPEAVQLPQRTGGHTRLILGYNAAARRILYSDSWGAGHELKDMAVTDAWSITTDLVAVEPRG